MMDLDLLSKVENAVDSVILRSDRKLHNQEIFDWYESICASILDSADYYGGEGELQAQLSMILATKARELDVGYDD